MTGLRLQRFLRPMLVALGLLLSLGLLGLQRGKAYASARPDACRACHEMVPRVEAWARGPHGRSARCMDCHVPHEGVMRRWMAKARAGVRHGTLHALGKTPAFLHLKQPSAQAVLQSNCLRCHETRLPREAWQALPSLGHPSVHTRPRPDTAFHADRTRPCADCHRATGHRLCANP